MLVNFQDIRVEAGEQGGGQASTGPLLRVRRFGVFVVRLRADSVVEAGSPGHRFGEREIPERQQPIDGVPRDDGPPDDCDSDEDGVPAQERDGERKPPDDEPHDRVRDRAGPTSPVACELIGTHATTVPVSGTIAVGGANGRRPGVNLYFTPTMKKRGMSEADRPRPPEWLRLDPDETVWFRASPSKNLLLAGVGVGFVILVVGSVGVGVVGDLSTGRLLSAAMLAVIVGLLGGVSLLTERREYVLTNKHAYKRAGLTARTVENVDLDRISDVTLEQPMWQHWVGVGSLHFVTEGTDEDLRFAFVENPRHAFKRATEYVESAREGRTIR